MRIKSGQPWRKRCRTWPPDRPRIAGLGSQVAIISRRVKILVTGGRGFLGSHLLAHLRSRYREATLATLSRQPGSALGLVSYVCDLSDPEATLKTVKAFEPDMTFHLAGNSRVRDELDLPHYFTDNFLSTTHLTQALIQLGKPQRLFFASSIHVYGNNISEVSEESPPQPFNPYGFTKYLAEEHLKEKTVAHPSLKVVVGRLYNCIGPGQPLGFVASDWCQRLRSLPDSGEAVMKVGGLEGIRYFLDVRDAVATFPRLLENTQESFAVYNIASKVPTRIDAVLEKLLKVSGKHPKIESNENESSNRFAGLRVSTAKLEKTLSSLQFRPLDETLRDMYSATK